MNFRKTAIIRALLVCAVLFLAPLAACEAASKNSGPEFKQSGAISGTPLQYQNLAVNKHGIAAVTIYNPTTTGVSFSATFSFYDGKGKYLGGFTVSGFSARNTRASYVEEIDYKAIRRAASVKVLGRSGRTTE